MTYPKQSKTVHVEMLNDELCLYDWQRKEVHALNPTAALVWQMCDGQTSPAQMAGRLKSDLTPAQTKALVWASLEQLRKAHLLAGEIAQPDGRPVLTRRQVLKVLGGAAAGAVLMPVVSSIVAPTPVEAQSPGSGPFAYVTNFDSDDVSVIDTTSNSVVATVAVGSTPYGVAVNPAGTRVYVANSSSDNVSVIDTASNSVVATVAVGSSPAAFGDFV